jgi:hypothetical protein
MPPGEAPLQGLVRSTVQHTVDYLMKHRWTKLFPAFGAEEAHVQKAYVADVSRIVHNLHKAAAAPRARTYIYSCTAVPLCHQNTCETNVQNMNSRVAPLGAHMPRTGVPAALPPSARPPLILWIDRHLHKNGGSTVREVMLRNEEAGHCVYYGYQQTAEGWRALLRELRAINGSTPRLPALCIEAHASTASTDWTSRRLPAMLELRARLASLAVPARIVVSTRVREPLEYYLSFYRWRIAGMQRANNTIRLSATRTVVNPIGSTFLEWSPLNLQATGLLHGDVELFAGLKAGGFPGVREPACCAGRPKAQQIPARRPHPYWLAHRKFGRADYDALLRLLRRAHGAARQPGLVRRLREGVGVLRLL